MKYLSFSPCFPLARKPWKNVQLSQSRCDRAYCAPVVRLFVARPCLGRPSLVSRIDDLEIPKNLGFWAVVFDANLTS